MGEIKADVDVFGYLKNKKISALLDSGAYWNYINKIFEDGECPEDIGYSIYHGTIVSILANGQPVRGQIIGFDKIHINGRPFRNPRFVIMEDMIDDIIIGVHLMQQMRLKLDPFRHRII